MFTTRSSTITILLVFLGLAGCYAEKTSKIEAVAFLTGPAKNNVVPTGNVTFTQNACGENVHVRVYLTGIAPGKHGFHVHEKGDLTNGCTSLAAHYNPEKLAHGGRTDEIRHVGDLGNLEANEQGVVDTTFTDHLISLTGPRTIIGRGLVVHEMIDDLGKTAHPESKKTGNSGGRVTCGVIGINIHALSPLASSTSCPPSKHTQPTFYVPNEQPHDHVVIPLLTTGYHYSPPYTAYHHTVYPYYSFY